MGVYHFVPRTKMYETINNLIAIVIRNRYATPEGLLDD